MKENKKTAFCINCDCDRTYHIVAKKRRRSALKNKTSFVYVERHAFCDICNEELYVAEINDLNVKTMYDAYFAAKKEVGGSD